MAWCRRSHVAAANRNLGDARKAKEDEFYTQLGDIQNELRHYKHHFKDKIVYCNCDDPYVSNFFRYFALNFEAWGLRKLVATCYRSQDIDLFSSGESNSAVTLTYAGDADGSLMPDREEVIVTPLAGDGDFRSAESIALLREADIVVTNPPFSLFREYVTQLMEHEKKFLIVGNQNAITYKDVFPLIQQGRMWLGHNSGDMKFMVPDHYPARATRFWVDDDGQKWRSLGNACWFTNLDIQRRHEKLILYRSYNEADYPRFDNYDAIEVSKVVDIPLDYDGVIGVPLTFLDKHNPDQFEIVGMTKTWCGCQSKTYPRQVQVSGDGRRAVVTKLNDGGAIRVEATPVGKTYYEVDGGKFVQVYPRLLIRRVS